MSRRHIKISQEVARLAGEFFARNGLVPGALVTVTRADMSDDLHQATILLSVLPSQHESAALHAARRARTDLREYVKTHCLFHPVPTFEVSLDVGEKNRQRIDELTSDSR